MKKIIMASLVIIILIVTLMLTRINSEIPIWEKNALEFSNALDTISGYQPVVTDLTDFTTFEWDQLYSFQPYFPKEKIAEIVGYMWTDINETVSEGMNQVVFLNEGEVVCYIYGYPDKYNVYFDFGYHREGYLLLNLRDKTKFIITVKEDINHFKFIEE